MWQIVEIPGTRRKPPSRRWKRLRKGRSGPAGRAKEERTMYIAVVRRNDTTRGEMEGRGGRPEGLSLSLLVSSTSPPRLVHVRFSDCLRAGTTKPAGPKDVNGKRRICLIDDGSGVDFISLVRTGGRKENEEAKGKTLSGEENGAA
ncbi:hypothetical protein G5I_08772 [Acromyrmex echinatior]|uniref:Uncharacterized protein n=1 Tax=Acromyrmex echinatior TaxID=103372 RepID=F4WSE2_ACREC|nr:hypothetical protein G5I_08772 [Acromyrmex echinatior]